MAMLNKLRDMLVGDFKFSFSARSIFVFVLTSPHWEFQDPKMEVLQHCRSYMVYMVCTSSLGSLNDH